jgi:hypothetical protein
VEGSESAYGRGHGPASMLAYLSTLAFDAVKLPPPYEMWLSCVCSSWRTDQAPSPNC